MSQLQPNAHSSPPQYNDCMFMFPYHDDGGGSSGAGDGDGDGGRVKKLNHNASERHRRKRINSLYATLTSLLPPQDNSKKLSIPTTVSRVLKYIPELQQQVQNLIQKKEALISSRVLYNNKNTNYSSLPLAFAAVSAARINDNETVVQWSIVLVQKGERGHLFEALEGFEEEGFLVINASCFHSFGNRVFYTVHLQGQGGQVMNVEILKEKVLSFFDKGQHIITN